MLFRDSMPPTTILDNRGSIAQASYIVSGSGQLKNSEAIMEWVTSQPTPRQVAARVHK
jgi:hypothetical protein